MKNLLAKGIIATKSIYCQWKAVFSPPSIDIPLYGSFPSIFTRKSWSHLPWFFKTLCIMYLYQEQDIYFSKSEEITSGEINVLFLIDIFWYFCMTYKIDILCICKYIYIYMYIYTIYKWINIWYNIYSII